MRGKNRIELSLSIHTRYRCEAKINPDFFFDIQENFYCIIKFRLLGGSWRASSCHKMDLVGKHDAFSCAVNVLQIFFKKISKTRKLYTEHNSDFTCDVSVKIPKENSLICSHFKVRVFLVRLALSIFKISIVRIKNIS